MSKLIIALVFVLLQVGVCYAKNMVMVKGSVDCYDSGCVVYEKGSDKSYFLGKFSRLSRDAQRCVDSGKEVLISGVLVKSDEFDVKSVMCKVTGK